MRDYDKLIKVLKTMAEKSRGLSMLTGINGDGLPVLFDDAADAIEELVAMACPHYHRNVHDRGDDSYCDVLNREVPKEGKR